MFTKDDQKKFKQYYTTGIEMRGIWHMPNTLKNYGYDETTLEGVQKLLDKIKDAGYNTILIETVNAYTIYKSKYSTVHPQFDFDNNQYGDEYKDDYLACFIGEAHKRNIAIHAWTTTMRAGSFKKSLSESMPESIKPEWLARGYHNEYGLKGKYGELMWLDPSNPEVVEYLINHYKELTTNYDLDGIELDAIRYPISNIMKTEKEEELSDFGYTQTGLAGFKEKYNYNGDFKKEIIENKDLRLKWVEYRCELISNIVEKVRDVVLEIKPNIPFSAAVLVHPDEAIAIACQDWHQWLENDWFDFVSPMAYSTELNLIKKSYEETEELTGNKLFNLQGIAAVIIEGGNYKHHFEQMNYINKAGGLGSILFQIRQFVMNETTYEMVKKIYKNNPAISPLMSLDDILDFIYNQTNNDYFKELKGKNYQEILNSLNQNRNQTNLDLINALIKTINIKLARNKK